jgi:gluconokinase
LRADFATPPLDTISHALSPSLRAGASTVTVAEVVDPRVLVLMGVSSCGKSTVAKILVERLKWDFVEGDDLHPATNVEKMEAGEPLTDEDRWPWLDKIATWITEHLRRDESGIVTCSALRRVYRDRLFSSGVVFVHLHGSRAVLAERASGREEHFMPSSLLDSQLEDLEHLQSDEQGIVVSIEATTNEQQADEILRRLELTPAKDA